VFLYLQKHVNVLLLIAKGETRLQYTQNSSFIFDAIANVTDLEHYDIPYTHTHTHPLLLSLFLNLSKIPSYVLYNPLIDTTS